MWFCGDILKLSLTAKRDVSTAEMNWLCDVVETESLMSQPSVGVAQQHCRQLIKLTVLCHKEKSLRSKNFHHFFVSFQFIWLLGVLFCVFVCAAANLECFQRPIFTCELSKIN